MQFSEKIKQLRSARNLTQSDLAKQLNVDRSTISGYETKQRQPSQDKLMVLADYLNVSVDYLLNDEYEIELSVASDSSLGIDEMELLTEYRTLSDTSKQQLKNHAKALNLLDLKDKGRLKVVNPSTKPEVSQKRSRKRK